MPDELGKIEKPSVEEFKIGRKLYFVPLLFSGKDLPEEFTEKYHRYWEQVDSQIINLENKLEPAKKIYHELVTESGEEGLKAIHQLDVGSYLLVQSRIKKGAYLEIIENNELLTEIMDWSRCLSIGLQNQKVISRIYEFYNEASKKRNEFIRNRIDSSLKENETGILFMGEGHHVQFPADIRIFYISPPALDEIKRWLRDYSAGAKESPPVSPESKENKAEENTV